MTGRSALIVGSLVLVLGASLHATDYPVRGMVLQVDRAKQAMTVSHDAIRGLMPAMTMTFEVRDVAELTGLAAGAVVDFTLAVGGQTSYAEGVQLRRYQSVEQDPRATRRLALLKRLAGGVPEALSAGQPVPDFTLIDQARQRVTLSGLAGKVVAVDFIYTRCALPQFCVRMSNNFSALQWRFKARLGRDLVLLTVTFDPARDTPAVLAKYAAQWQADSHGWHFLTGRAADVQRICARFGVQSFVDDGLFDHSLRTAIISPRRTLVASIEGNQYSVEQLGDLVETALNHP